MSTTEWVVNDLNIAKFMLLNPQMLMLAPEMRIRAGQAVTSAIGLLKEQENVVQKMWNALHAEEDRLEKKFVGTDKHNDWFTVYRPWLQNGFEIGLKVIAEQEEQNDCIGYSAILPELP